MTTRTRLVLIAGGDPASGRRGAGLRDRLDPARCARPCASYSELVAASATVPISPTEQRLDRGARLCSSRYLSTRSLSLGPEGGIVGLPRTINKNFQAWREGPNVWICPTNRIGPVYQFVSRERRTGGSTVCCHSPCPRRDHPDHRNA